MRRSSVLRFETLIQLMQTGCHEVSLCRLLGLSVSPLARPYSAETLFERFRGTWWQVVWPDGRSWGAITKDVQCKYVADSFRDALRRCPRAEFPHLETAEILEDDDFSYDVDTDHYRPHADRLLIGAYSATSVLPG